MLKICTSHANIDFVRSIAIVGEVIETIPPFGECEVSPTKESYHENHRNDLCFDGCDHDGGVAVAADKDLVIFDWAGYEDENFYLSYIEKHGDQPTYSFFSDEEEAFNKIVLGSRQMAHPCSQSVIKWREAGIIEPFDTSRIKLRYIIR